MAKQIKAPQHRTLPAPPSTRTSCNAANAETKDLIRKFSLSHTHNATSPVDDDAHTVRTVKWKVRQPAHIEIIVTEKSEPVEKMDDASKKITKKAAARNRFVKVGAA
jgi:hypothetical protein